MDPNSHWTPCRHDATGRRDQKCNHLMMMVMTASLSRQSDSSSWWSSASDASAHSYTPHQNYSKLVVKGEVPGTQYPFLPQRSFRIWEVTFLILKLKKRFWGHDFTMFRRPTCTISEMWLRSTLSLSLPSWIRLVYLFVCLLANGLFWADFGVLD